MKASEIGFLEFLRQADQLAVPIYQRTYSWTNRQLEQLWRDVAQAARSGQGHFVGSVVYILGEGEIGRVTPAQVIDGQQRLTTVSLLLVALARRLEKLDGAAEMTTQRLRSRYLVNRDEEGEDRFKLLLGKTDKETMIRIVEGYEPPQTASPRVVAALEFFSLELEKTALSADEVFAGIEQLDMVGIALDRRYDNPQLIFDSLNSTGLDLSEADRIRNFVLMDLAPKEQQAIYEASWYPMERLFAESEGTEQFDRFVRDYLTVKTGQIPKIDQVYEAFKGFAATTGLSRGELVAETYHFAKLWVRIAFESELDDTLRSAIADINRLRVDVAYPFLLDVLDDEANEKIDRDDVVQIFRTVESYVFRRAICAIPTNTLNKTFAGLAREIDEANYMESFFATLLLKESYGRMPSNEEFRSQLVVRDVYNFRNRNYLLDKLENFERKEPVRVDDFTIEHVLPQNPELSPAWQEQLGPEWQLIQERLLHTLGNVTLTGYNSELSDRPFAEKLSMLGGFRQSPLHLNQYLAQLEHWNEQEIESRAKHLAETAVKVWPAPSLPEPVLAKYRRSKITSQPTYTLEQHPELEGPVGAVFRELRRRVLNLDAGIREDIRKQYIAYKFAGNFLCVVPLQSELKLYLNVDLDQLTDPQGLAKDVSTVGHWGTGNTGARLKSEGGLDDVMALVRQAFELQADEGYQEPQWPEAAVEALIEQIGQPDVEQAVRAVLEACVRSGLYPRPWTRSLMFAPPANRSRGLFTLTLRDDARVDLYCAPDAFQTFFKLDPAQVERQIGPAGSSTTIGLDELRGLPDRIEELMADAEIPAIGQTRAQWNGRDFYVVLGGGRNWGDCLRFGFVSGGGGGFYSKPLEQLFPGARVFAYMPSHGYVGVGRVRDTSKPITEFNVLRDGNELPLLEMPDLDPVFTEFADDPERREHVVGIEWLASRTLDDAVWQTGLFTNQVTVCRLRDEDTIQLVSEQMGIDGREGLAPDDGDQTR